MERNGAPLTKSLWGALPTTPGRAPSDFNTELSRMKFPECACLSGHRGYVLRTQCAYEQMCVPAWCPDDLFVQENKTFPVLTERSHVVSQTTRTKFRGYARVWPRRSVLVASNNRATLQSLFWSSGLEPSPKSSRIRASPKRQRFSLLCRFHERPCV